MLQSSGSAPNIFSATGGYNLCLARHIFRLGVQQLICPQGGAGGCWLRLTDHLRSVRFKALQNPKLQINPVTVALAGWVWFFFLLVSFCFRLMRCFDKIPQTTLELGIFTTLIFSCVFLIERTNDLGVYPKTGGGGQQKLWIPKKKLQEGGFPKVRFWVLERENFIPPPMDDKILMGIFSTAYLFQH